MDLFLEILSSSETSHNLKVQSLRIVGNSCADTDENRARVVDNDKLAILIKQLKDESLLPYAIPVLFNTLVDYGKYRDSKKISAQEIDFNLEPAQLLASKSKLNIELTALLTSPNLPNYADTVPYICKILALLVAQDGEPAVANPQTVEILLTLATSSDDADDFISLVSLAAAYLANETFQASLVTGSGLGLFLAAFGRAYTEFDDEADEDPDTATSLKHLRTSLLTSLADLTGNDSFATHHSLDSPVPQKLMEWLEKGHSHLQSAACLALGNLSRSDEISSALVQTHNVHQPLLKTLSNSAVTDAQQLHSALSFLKNLAIPAENKIRLGGLLDASCVPRILSLDTLPQVQFASISLIRLLLVNCPPNVRQICTPLEDLPYRYTIIHGIISLFQRSDAEPTKLEAARSILALCRVIHSNPVDDMLPDWEADKEGDDLHGEEITGPRDRFYKKHPELPKVLSFLVTQPKWPILRSEAWFVFALMSRSKDGATVVLKILSIQEAANALTHAVTGQTVTESNEQKQIEDATSDPTSEVTSLTSNLQLEPQQVDPKQKDSMTRIDRENCLVLCTEIAKTLGDEVPTAQASLLRDLIKQGTELVITSRQG